MSSVSTSEPDTYSPLNHRSTECDQRQAQQASSDSKDTCRAGVDERSHYNRRERECHFTDEEKELDRQQPLYWLSKQLLSFEELFFPFLQEAKAEKEQELNATKQPLDRKGEDQLSGEKLNFFFLTVYNRRSPLTAPFPAEQTGEEGSESPWFPAELRTKPAASALKTLVFLLFHQLSSAREWKGDEVRRSSA